MFTKENVCSEIKELYESPVMSQSAELLACLLYIRKHYDYLLEAVREEDEESPLVKKEATEWTKGMENADGTSGPHWTMEKTEESRIQRGIQCAPLEFYVAMNMMYSDYVKAAEKVNCSSLDLYAFMAQAFLDDKDAQPDKLARYYWYVVER